MKSTVLGYPGIGAQPELTKAIEAFWVGRSTAEDLESTAAELRRGVWEALRDAGLDGVPSNTFSFHDHVLDTAVMVGAVPKRFAGPAGLDAYFAMARGADGVAPLELAKWFDTGCHYLVPELGPGTDLRLAGDKPLHEYTEAWSLGVETRPVLLGPVSFLLLSKAAEPGFWPLILLDLLLGVYAKLLADLHVAGCEWCNWMSRCWPRTGPGRNWRRCATPITGWAHSTGVPRCWSAPASGRSGTRWECWRPARWTRSGWTSWPVQVTARRWPGSAGLAGRPWSQVWSTAGVCGVRTCSPPRHSWRSFAASPGRWW
jgi:Cobalamin-independent synthase, N-terminal domain